MALQDRGDQWGVIGEVSGERILPEAWVLSTVGAATAVDAIRGAIGMAVEIAGGHGRHDCGLEVW